MLPSTGPICAPPSGDMVLLPGVPPLALMVPCRPLGRPNGLEGLPILLWQLGGCSQVLSKIFGRRPLQTFEAAPAPGATMLRWPASARREPAQPHF